MSVYKRGSVFWYDFIRDGIRYQGSTDRTNKNEARDFESDEKKRIKDEQKDRKAAAERLGVQLSEVSRCPECDKRWFDNRNAGVCSDECARDRERRKSPANGITFRQQAEIWLNQLQTRNRRPIPDSSVPSIRAALDCWLLPLLGDRPLSQIGNATLNELVKTMVGTLSPKSINTYVNMAKAVVQSVLDVEGEPVYARKWNNDVIDLPIINKREQNRPTLTAKEISAVVASCMTEWERMLYILCAASGMRIAEALALNIDDHISADCSMIHVRQQVKGSCIVGYLKTSAAWRDIDLCPELARLLLVYIGNRKGLLFPSQTGRTPMSYANLRNRSLHPKLAKLGIYSQHAGAHCFRRFRAAELKRHGCPDDLRKFWLGHENADISDHYAEQLLCDEKRRRQWAVKVGLGFKVPSPYDFHYSNQLVNVGISAGSSLTN